MVNPRVRSLVVFFVPLAVASVLAGCGNNPDKASERAFRAAQQQDWIGASLYAREFINRFPEDQRIRDIYNLLVNCHLRLGDWALARSVCEEIVQRFPDELTRAGAEQVLGRTYLGEGNFDRALASFSQIADSTTHIRFRLLAIDDVATAYEIMAGRVGSSTAPEWGKAESVYNDWLALAALPEAASNIPDITSARANILQRRAQIWAQAGDFRKAADAFGAIAAASYIPDLNRAEGSYLRSESLQVLFRGRDRKAPLTPEARQELIHSFEQTAQDFSETDYGIWARVELCKLYKPTDPEKAEMHLSEAVKRYQKYVDNPAEPAMLQFYMTKIGDAYLHVEEIDRAEKAFQDLRKTFPDNQQVVQYTDRKLQAIRDFRAKPSGIPSDATKSGETPTPSAG
jgi:pentatricopeptide repeat protein